MILPGAASMLDVSLPVLEATAAIAPLPPRRITSLASPASGTLPPAGKRFGKLLWNGPNSWLLLDEDPAPYNALTTDQSDGLFLFAISGPDMHKILRQLIGIDLHPSVFAEDSVAITIAAHIGIRIWREEQKFILACFRSFAAALHHALAEAEQNARG